MNSDPLWVLATHEIKSMNTQPIKNLNDPLFAQWTIDEKSEVKVIFQMSRVTQIFEDRILIEILYKMYKRGQFWTSCIGSTLN